MYQNLNNVIIKQAVAFRDVKPVTPVHFLVIPKNRDGLTGLSKAEDKHVQLLGHLLVVVAKVAAQEKLDDGYRVVINDGKNAGQTVFHLHIHVIGGKTLSWPPGLRQMESGYLPEVSQSDQVSIKRFDPIKKEKERTQQVKDFITEIQHNPGAIRLFLTELNRTGMTKQSIQSSQRARSNKYLSTGSQIQNTDNQSQSRLIQSRNLASRGINNSQRRNKDVDLQSSIDERSYLISRGNMSNILQSEGVPTFSKTYYQKYIEKTNRQIYEQQLMKKSLFIPEKEAESKSFQQKFQFYLKKLTDEELLLEQQKQKKGSQQVQQQQNQRRISRMPTFEANDDFSVSRRRRFKQNQFQTAEEVTQKVPRKNSLTFEQTPKNGIQTNQFSKTSRDQGFQMQNTKLRFSIESNQDNLSQIKATAVRDGKRFLQINDKFQSRKSKILSDAIISPIRIGDQSSQRNDDSNIRQGEGDNRSSKLVNKNFQQERKEKLLLYFMEQMKKIKEAMQGDYFKIICQDTAKESLKNSRLSKAKFKQFLALRYGPQLAEKLHFILDFNNPVDFLSYQTQIDAFVKNKDLLIQVGFDIYDYNIDGKITEMDLFKMFTQFGKQQQAIFDKVFQKDLLVIFKFLRSKQIKNSNNTKQQKFVLEQELSKYFRNLNQQDFNFVQKKKQIFASMFKIQRMAQTGEHWGSRLFSNEPGRIGLIHQNELQDKEREETGNDQQEENFFASSPYYQHLSRMKAQHKKTLTQKQGLQNKQFRNNSIAKQNINPYIQHKLQKQKNNLNQTMPITNTNQMLNNGPQTNFGLGLQQKNILIQNPLWDGYFTSYVEDAQQQITEYIKLDEFTNLKFQGMEFPCFIIDFVEYLTGTQQLFQQIISAIYIQNQRKKSNGYDIDNSGHLRATSSSDDDSLF